MTPLVAYLLGLMTFPTAMGMVFYTRLMRVALEQARQQIESEIEAERLEQKKQNNP